MSATDPPFPEKYAAPGRMKNGDPILLRPIRPDDEPLMIKFHQALSDRTVYLRYFQSLRLSQRTAHERLSRICSIDFDQEMVLVAEHKQAGGDPEIVAVGRLSRLRDRDRAEMAALVDDYFQHQGLGTELYRRLLEIAREEKLTAVESTILAENRDMLAICRKFGFLLKTDFKDGTVQATLKL
jgi:acetyltransferase